MGRLWYNICCPNGVLTLNVLIMRKLLLKGRTAVAILSGLLFVGMIFKTIDDKIPTQIAQANQNTVLPTKEEKIDESVQVESVVTKKVVDKRVTHIKQYLSKRNSPLAKHAQDFVDAADKYGIDYRLVASISIIESGGGKNTFRPYNAWGWGKSGFANWKEGIYAVSKGLDKYYSKGLTTPNLISKSYCPPSADNWAKKVQYVMNEISK